MWCNHRFRKKKQGQKKKQKKKKERKKGKRECISVQVGVEQSFKKKGLSIMRGRKGGGGVLKIAG